MATLRRPSLAAAALYAAIALSSSSVLVTPTDVFAQEPSALDQRDYDAAIKKLKSELDYNIKRNNTIYETTVERSRKELKPILARMKRDGVDISSREKEIDTIVEDAYARLAVAQTQKLRGAIKKNVPKVAPEPGIDAIQPVMPTWCDSIDAASKGPSKASSIAMPSSAATITLLSIREALEFSCGAKDFDLTQKWTAAYRQELSNKLGLSAEENLELVTYAASTYTKLEYDAKRKIKEQPTGVACASFAAPESALVEDQMTRYLERSLLRCKGRVTKVPTSQRLPFRGTDMYWFVDLAGYPSTHVARLGLAERFLLRDVSAVDLANPIKARNPFLLINNYALAGALPIEKSEVMKELSSQISDGEALWSAKLEALGTLRDLERARAFVLRQAEGNPGFEAVFIDAPAKGYASYADVAKSGEDELELVLALEDKLMRGDSIEGCGEAVYEKLEPWIKAQHKAKKFKHQEDVTFDDYEGSLILQAALMCGANDTANVPGLAMVFEEYYYAKTDSQRGPLSAAYTSMFEAFNAYRANPPKSKKKKSFSRKRGGASDGFVQLKLEGLYPSPIARPYIPSYSAGFRYTKINNGLAMKLMKGKRPTTLHALQGVIKKVGKAQGGRVEISFKRESYKSPIRDCKETGRIDRIDDQGRFVPEYRCKTVGYEKVKVELDPILVPEWAAKNLKKGQSLVYFATEPVKHKKQPSYGWPVASFKSKKAKKLIGLYGVKL